MKGLLAATDNATAEAEEKGKIVRHLYAKSRDEMDAWVISEDSVTIRCQLFVAIILTIAGIVVCGGMTVPFVVGTRIRGVDPFQISTFSWLIAGAIIVLAKSKYVSVWPWHDFLHGRVVCKSVGDVTDVTGISRQMVLMKLLHDERNNDLVTRGPYNGMFKRRAAGSGGFSIDESVHLSTMIASGFVIFKVLNEKGEHLICIDVRKGASGKAPTRGEDDTFLAYLDIGKDAIQEDTEDASIRGNENTDTNPDVSHSGPNKQDSRKTKDKSSEKVLKLIRKEFRWTKVLGVYVRDSRFG